MLFGLNEALVWAIGAALVALVIAVVVTWIVAQRNQTADRAYTEANVGALRQQQEQKLAELAKQVDTFCNTFDHRVSAHDQKLLRVDETTTVLAHDLSALQQRLQELDQRVDREATRVQQARTEITLMEAADQATKARTHLAEQNAGLAERDLTEADASLMRALSVAPNDWKPEIEQVRRGLSELKQGVEARTFPVASVEMVVDQIYALLAGPPSVQAIASQRQSDGFR